MKRNVFAVFMAVICFLTVGAVACDEEGVLSSSPQQSEMLESSTSEQESSSSEQSDDEESSGEHELTVIDKYGNKEKDQTKTQIEIGFWYGAFDYAAWIRNVADDFEEYYKEVMWEEGKQGVQVTVLPKTTAHGWGDTNVLTEKIQQNLESSDVLLTGAQYYAFDESEVLTDISSCVHEQVYDDKGELAANGYKGVRYSLRDRMDDYFAANYQREGRYYGVPFEDNVMGLVYDVDLFEENGYTVPTNLEDFYSLLVTMSNAGIVPFTWASSPFYRNAITSTIVAQYEGIEGAEMNVTYRGVMDGTTITPQNAYLLSQQQGKYKALEFWKRIADNPHYLSPATQSESQTHLAAKYEYILSAVRQDRGRIAMLLDIDLWEKEGIDAFDAMEKNHGEEYGYGQRRFAFMPFPTIEGQKTDKKVLYSYNGGTAAFINPNTTKKQLAEKWIQFMYTRSSLAEFTQCTGSVLPYQYDLKPEEYAELTYFAKSVYDLRRDEDVVIARSSNPCQELQQGLPSVGGFGSVFSPIWEDPFRYFLTGDMTIEEYWELYKHRCEEAWQGLV